MPRVRARIGPRPAVVASVVGTQDMIALGRVDLGPVDLVGGRPVAMAEVQFPSGAIVRCVIGAAVIGVGVRLCGADSAATWVATSVAGSVARSSAVPGSASTTGALLSTWQPVQFVGFGGGLGQRHRAVRRDKPCQVLRNLNWGRVGVVHHGLRDQSVGQIGVAAGAQHLGRVHRRTAAVAGEIREYVAKRAGCRHATTVGTLPWPGSGGSPPGIP